MNEQTSSQPENKPPESAFHPTATGRTGWDALTATIQSKLVWGFLFSLLALLILWLFWDSITSMPIYVISSILLSTLWYSPITRWLSRSSTYIEVWEPSTNTLTTYRVGRQLFSEISREGLQNTVSSKSGSNRIFASQFDPELLTLTNSWVHECDPWTYHTDIRTLTNLTDRVTTVFSDIVDAEALAQVQGRAYAMEAMRRHYNDLDNLFFGESEVMTNGNNQHSEAHSDNTASR